MSLSKVKKFFSLLRAKSHKKDVLIKNIIYRPAVVILSIQIIIFGLYIYDHRRRFEGKFRQFTNYIELSFDTLHPKDLKDYVQDFFMALVSFNQLERIDLSFSINDIKKLDCLRLKNNKKIYKKGDCTSSGWVNAELFSKNEKFRIKLKAKGDRPVHRMNINTMSYKIDIKGDKRLRGIEEFALQLPLIRNYTYEPMAARALREVGLISPKNFYVRLFINGKYAGIRHIEEGLSKELIERSKKRYGPVFSLNENEGAVYDENSFDLADKKFWDNTDSDLPSKALFILRESQKNPEIFNKYFDTKKWAKYMAMLDTLFMYHGMMPKSVKYFLNPITGLIEPIFYDGHLVKGIWGKDFRLTNMLSSSISQLSSCQPFCENIYFFKMLIGEKENINKKFYVDYLYFLEKYSSKDFVKSVYRKEWDKLWLERGSIYKEFSKRDAIIHEGIFPNVGSFQNLEKRFHKIRNELLIAKKRSPIHSYSKSKDLIIVENKASVYPQIYSLFCGTENSIDELILFKNIPKSSKPLSSYGCNLNQIFFSLDNGETKYNLKNKLIANPDFNSKAINANINIFDAKNQTYIFDSKNIEIKEDLIIDNKDVIFSKSSKIILSNGSVLKITNSNININGKVNNPVHILGDNNNSRGSLLIENSNINIGYLNVSDLRAPIIDLRNLYGGVNIINSNVNGNYLTIKNSKSEDAINLIDSSLKLDYLHLDNILSDALDSDFSKFKINKIICNEIGNDCVDLSFSEGYVGRLDGIKVYDKVISAGENSTLNISDIIINDSEIGVVAKDDSHIKINSYNFFNVKVPLSSYIKKSEFGSPSVKVNQSLNNNISSEYISFGSLVEINGQILKGSSSSKKIYDIFYGKEFGVKTKR